jgi:hypothetical protein
MLPEPEPEANLSEYDPNRNRAQTAHHPEYEDESGGDHDDIEKN